MDNLNLGILLGLGAMLGFGVSNGIMKIPAMKLSAAKNTFYRNLFTSLTLLPALLFLEKPVFSWGFFLVAVLVSIIGYFPLITFYKGLKVGKVGIIAPVSNSAVLYTIILSIIFFNEQITLFRTLAFLVMFAGIILISVDFKDISLKHILTGGILYAFLTSLGWGLYFFIVKIPSTALGPIFTAFITETGIMIWAAIHMKIKDDKFGLEDKSLLKYLIPLAITGGAAVALFNYGVIVADVSVVSALALSNPLIATIYGRLVYKEKLTFQQYIATGFIILGIVLISI